MAVFENLCVLLELKPLPYKEKKKVRLAITDNGGSVCFVVNKQCSLIVTSDLSNLSSNRLRSIQKHQTPVVDVDYVYKCLTRGALLPVDEYKLDISSPSDLSPSPVLSSPKQASVSHKVPKQTSQAVTQAPNGQVKPHYPDSQRAESPERSGNILEKFRVYTETDYNLPTFPDNFQVAKYSVFEKVNSNTLYMLELQSAKGEDGRQYCVVQYFINNIEAKKAAVKDKLVFVPTSEDALQVYLALIETLKNSGLNMSSKIPPQAKALISGPLQQLLLEEELNTGTLSEEVGIFVELLWTEAHGCLGNVLRVPIHMLSLNDVSRAEGLLLQAQKQLTEGNNSEVATLLEEFYDLLPHSTPPLPPSVKLISQKLDLCQLIRDVLNVSEMTLKNPMPSCVGKYRALRCNIEAVPSSSSEFQAVSALLQDSRVQIKQVLCVSRGVELQMFKSELGNIRPLLHSSSPSNFVGILSRGLLLPRVGVEHHGIERTDIGNLGSGIYFSDAISTSLKYSSPSTTDGSRLLLVCEVALGRCSDLHKKDFTLTQAPEGHHSVHGVRRNTNVKSEFEDDEYVVYSPDQVKLKYVVQFSLQGDQVQEFSPPISTSAELPSFDQGVYMENEGVENIKNPQDDVKAGLLDSSGQQLPLQAVHVKGKLIDLLAEVIIFQKYTNTSSVPIEAKYVFPLDQSAAVCGFEAFINGKHVVGQVKEKETARKEYKQAIEKGHGAYLMDQDAPDVFTISVGNLPPGATVLIKVTFVSELIVKDGSIFFSLPGSVAPWQESEALNQTTQVTLEKVCMTDVPANTREFTLDLSIEMPYEIASLNCLTHKVKMKRTDCKAVLSVLPGLVMGPEGFQLSISLSEVHLPRMWVEKHPDKNSQACMLVFYPHFEINSSSGYDEVILLLDTSESMKGESLHMAQRIALQVLKTLPQNLRINVILFGTDYNEAFPTARPMVEACNMAEVFIQSFVPVGGSTELWRPLQALNLLPPTRGIRNLLLFSDGHIQNPELTLKLIRDNAQHSRVFTCGLSPTANRHMLRAMAQAGAGAYEFFDTKTKHTWAEKVACQIKRMASPGCSSVSVKWQQFSPSAPSPMQAPKHIHALFNDCHTLVFGFVPHCTQATLLGNLSGQELKTMVSTSELQKTKGTFLHKLTARALIRDYEDGNLEIDEAEHEGKKAELKSYIVELSKEFSILSQFTSFVAIEERDSGEIEQGFTDIPKLIAEEDVDILPYISWMAQVDTEKEAGYSRDSMLFESCDFFAATIDESDDEDLDVGYCLVDTEMGGYESEESCQLYEALPLEDWVTGSPLELRGFLPKPCKERSILPKSLDTRAVSLVTFSGTAPPPSPPPPAFHSYDSSPALSTSTVPPPVPPVSDITMSNRICQLQVRAKQSAPPPPPSADLEASALLSAPSAPLTPVLFHSYGSLASASAFSVLPPVLSMLESFDSQIVQPGSLPHLPPPHPRPHASFSTTSSFLPRGGAASCSPAYTEVPSMPANFSVCPQSRNDHPSALDLSKLHSDLLGAPKSAPPSHIFNSLSPSPPVVGNVNTSASHSVSPLLGAPGSCPLNLLQSCLPPSAFDLHTASPDSYFTMPNPLSSSDNQPFGFSASAAAVYPPKKRKAKLSFLGSSQPLFGSSMFAESDKHQLQEEPFGLSVGNRYMRSSVSSKTFQRKARTGTVQAMKLKWTKIYQMQHTEGYWELTAELGELINVDVDAFANVFLKNKGINSLGAKARSEILRLVATLLVLQLMRTEGQEEGKLLQTLFSLKDSDPRPERWDQVQRAVTWACRADRQYPCIYSRLEFGFSWESSTRQLLGYEDLPPFSPLTGLNLQKTIAPVMVH